MYGELLKQMDDLSELREQVIEASDISLPNFFWITTAGLLIVALGLASATSDSLKQRVAVAATAAAVALLLTFVIIIDRPFEGGDERQFGPHLQGAAAQQPPRRSRLRGNDETREAVARAYSAVGLGQSAADRRLDCRPPLIIRPWRDWR